MKREGYNTSLSWVLVVYLLHCSWSAAKSQAVPYTGPCSHPDDKGHPYDGFLEIPNGALFGASLTLEENDFHFQKDNTAYYNQLGRKPASLTAYLAFPLRNAQVVRMHMMLSQAAINRGHVLFILEPYVSVESISQAEITTMTDIIYRYQMRGARVSVAIMPEMNTPFRLWGMRPTQYIPNYRRIATAIRQQTCRTALVWAPALGFRYPFTGEGPYSCTNRRCTVPASSGCSCADFKELDTVGDGSLNLMDNMYSPFYPGDEYVDLVGTYANYVNREKWDRGGNEIPPANFFYETLTGAFKSQHANLYQFAVDHDKSFMVLETAAWFNLERVNDGETELDIKRQWWEQVFAVGQPSVTSVKVDISKALPRLKVVHWLDVARREPLFRNHNVSWGLLGEEQVKQGFLSYTTATGYWWDLAKFRDYLDNGLQPPSSIPDSNAGGANPSGDTGDSGESGGPQEGSNSSEGGDSSEGTPDQLATSSGFQNSGLMTKDGVATAGGPLRSSTLGPGQDPWLTGDQSSLRFERNAAVRTTGKIAYAVLAWALLRLILC